MVLQAMGQSMNVRWNNEAADTTRITELLKEQARLRIEGPGRRTAWFARQLLGTPYVAHTLEGQPEELTINLDGLDCTTLAETVLALSFTAGERRQGWQDFVYNLRRFRYRNAEVNGYASRLHYICDWAMDNIHRGNVIDVTNMWEGAKYAVRSIDFMSQNRDKYEALKDSAEFERIRAIENGYRNHRFPYIKSSDLGAKDINYVIRQGDILAFVTNLKNLDVTHMGIVVEENGKLHVLHASSTNGKVEISKAPLADFARRNRSWIGVRVFRIKE